MKTVLGSAWICVVVGCGGESAAGLQAITKHDNGNVASRGSMLNDEAKVGEWVYFYDNGQKEKQGHYINNLMQGTWTFWLADGSDSWTAQYEKGAGANNGRITTAYKNGQKKTESTYRDGRQHGVATVWHETGRAIQEQHYRNGRQDGRRTQWFFATGKKRLEDHWKDGQREGLESQWHPSGQLASEGNLVDNQKDGVWTRWHRNGSKQSEDRYKSSLKEGAALLWYDNGQLQMRGSWVAGKEDGTWNYWNRDGSFKRSLTLKDGKPVK